MYFGRALYERAAIKDIVCEFFGRLNYRKCLRDAGAVKRKAAVVVYKLIRLGYAGLFKSRVLSFSVPLDEKTIPFFL